MNEYIPPHLQDVIECLQDLAQQQGLREQARGGFRRWYDNDLDCLPSMATSPDDVVPSFKNQSLCFTHERLSYPYILTTFDLLVDDDKVGYYTLVTLLDGTPEDDYLVFYENDRWNSPSIL